MSSPDPLNGRRWAIEVGEVGAFLSSLPDSFAHTCVTSPPYWGLRDYGVDGQIGLEESPQQYVERMVGVFREVRRVLRPDGTLWLNLGDTYITHPHGPKGANTHDPKYPGGRERGRGKAGQANRRHVGGFKHKDLVGIPWSVAMALRADGWHLRADIIWDKPNAMPAPARGRPTLSHEYLFLLSPSPKYFYDAQAIAEKAATAGKAVKQPDGWDTSTGQGGHGSIHRKGRSKGQQAGHVQGATRNKRSVWRIPVARYKDAHFATFPPKLVEPCVLAGTSERGACPRCGAQAVREVERTRVPTRPGVDVKYLPKSDGDQATAEANGWNRPNVIGNRDPKRHVTKVETVGWRAGCKCGEDLAGFVPPVVLEPFAGSGTTLAVAVGLGRRAIGCDLNAEYVEMARRRVSAVVPSLA